MYEQPRNVTGTSSHILRSCEQSCGHILIGKRQYNVMLASDIASQQNSDEKCRFVLDGRTLVVAEAKDRQPKSPNKSPDDVLSRLTGRELEITVLVAKGYANKNIAFKLQISEFTVSTYLCRIFAKLGVNSRAAMVYRCSPLIDQFQER
jgi:DNA-binding NarL/FixJ family response regulator